VDGSGNVGNKGSTRGIDVTRTKRRDGCRNGRMKPVNYDVRGTDDEFGRWLGLNLLYR
jgi:hypothetical protein